MALEHIWIQTHAKDSVYMRVFIRALRAKFGRYGGSLRHIFAADGVGYLSTMRDPVLEKRFSCGLESQMAPALPAHHGMK